MATIIAIASHKGGVGKTTTALNLGYGLTRLGAKVLLVDGDPQGGLANASNLKRRTQAGLVQLLTNDRRANEMVTYTRDQRMAVIGAGVVTTDDVLQFEELALAGQLAISIRELAHDFDYVLIDAPAGIGGVVRGLLLACDSVIVTLNPRPLAVKSLPSFLKLIKSMADSDNPGLRLEGVLVTMMNAKSQVDASVFAQLQAQLPGAAMFATHIPFNEAFEVASLHATPVALLPAAALAARPYLDLALELKARELKAQAEESADDSSLGLF